MANRLKVCLAEIRSITLLILPYIIDPIWFPYHMGRIFTCSSAKAYTYFDYYPIWALYISSTYLKSSDQ